MYTLTASGNGSTTATVRVTVQGDSGSATYGSGGSHTPVHVTNVTGGGAKPSTAGGYTLAGAAGNCSTDDTVAFRNSASAAASQGKPLVIPAPAGACYKVTGSITVRTSVIGVGHPTIKMFGATGSGSYVILSVRGNNLWITGLHLDGGWDGTTPPSGSGPPQWSHGIDISSSTGVTVYDNLIERTLGDNIYIGGDGRASNVLVSNNTLLYAWRCTIAFINSDHVVVINNRSHKYNNFVMSYDFEPNSPSSESDDHIELAYNDISIALDWTEPNGPTDNYLAAVGVACGTGHGSYLFLHHNYGSFGGPDLWVDGGTPGFFFNATWDPGSSCSAAWNGGASNHTSGIYVYSNASGTSPR